MFLNCSRTHLRSNNILLSFISQFTSDSTSQNFSCKWLYINFVYTSVAALPTVAALLLLLRIINTIFASYSSIEEAACIIIAFVVINLAIII